MRRTALFLLLTACTGSTGSVEAPPDKVKVECLMHHNLRCELDTFEYKGRTCVRWENGYGSDMECWETEGE